MAPTGPRPLAHVSSHHLILGVGVGSDAGVAAVQRKSGRLCAPPGSCWRAQLVAIAPKVSAVEGAQESRRSLSSLQGSCDLLSTKVARIQAIGRNPTRFRPRLSQTSATWADDSGRSSDSFYGSGRFRGPLSPPPPLGFDQLWPTEAEFGPRDQPTSARLVALHAGGTDLRPHPRLENPSRARALFCLSLLDVPFAANWGAQQKGKSGSASWERAASRVAVALPSRLDVLRQDARLHTQRFPLPKPLMGRD